MLKVMAALPIALVGLMASMSYVVVDVKTEEGPRFVIPVPLVAARAALPFVPEDANYIPCPELAEYHEAAERLVQALIEAPDGELIHVEEGDETVFISKTGETLEIEVHEGDQDVSVTLPLEAVAELLSRYDGEGFEASDVVAALGSVSRSDLVHVRDGEQEVKVWIW
jgi:hypothetical protein